jgi:hypothetical protein
MDPRLVAMGIRESLLPQAFLGQPKPGGISFGVESSLEQVRHGLSWAANRRINHALHMMAVTQIRYPATPGRAHAHVLAAAVIAAREQPRCSGQTRPGRRAQRALPTPGTDQPDSPHRTQHPERSARHDAYHD